MHVRKTHTEVPAVVVIHGKGWVLISYLRVIQTNQSLKKKNRACLKFNRL